MPVDVCRVDLRWPNLVTVFNMVFNAVVSFYLLELLKLSHLTLFFRSIYNIYSRSIYEVELVGFGIICTYVCKYTTGILLTYSLVWQAAYLSLGAVGFLSVIRIEIVNYYNRSIFLPMTFLFLLRSAGYLFPAGE